MIILYSVILYFDRPHIEKEITTKYIMLTGWYKNKIIISKYIRIDDPSLVNLPFIEAGFKEDFKTELTKLKILKKLYE